MVYVLALIYTYIFCLFVVWCLSLYEKYLYRQRQKSIIVLYVCKCVCVFQNVDKLFSFSHSNPPKKNTHEFCNRDDGNQMKINNQWLLLVMILYSCIPILLQNTYKFTFTVQIFVFEQNKNINCQNSLKKSLLKHTKNPSLFKNLDSLQKFNIYTGLRMIHTHIHKKSHTDLA